MFVAIIKGNGLSEMTRDSRAFVQFACSANETADDDLFFKHLLRNIDRKNVPIPKLFNDIAEDVYYQRRRKQRPFYQNGLSNGNSVYLNQEKLETRT